MATFPFGRPVLPCRPTATSARPLFVLGAYPSALHVHWQPPRTPGLRSVRALAVDNEPEAFWTGEDQEVRVAAWAESVGWQESWGEVRPTPRFNGPSGQWVQQNILKVLGFERSATWITDCLDTYRASVGMRVVIDTVYQVFAEAQGLPRADLDEHPSERQIVDEARSRHLQRLRAEIAVAAPAVVVTLGNAALQVFRECQDAPSGPTTLVADDTYGQGLAVRVDGRYLQWLPLTHPAAPARYQDAHDAWVRRTTGQAE